MRKLVIVSLIIMLWCRTDHVLSYYPDVNKTEVDDTLMCWAAAASNVLAWTGWAIGDEYDVMQEFKDYFPDAGGVSFDGWIYYFKWHYPDLNFNDYYRYSGPFIPELANQWLSEGYGVTFDRTGHCMTLWGVDIDPVTGLGIRVHYTDSDDGIAGVRSSVITFHAGRYFFGTTISGYTSMGGLWALASAHTPMP